MSKVLVIIDAQKDFIDGGKLEVKGSITKMFALAAYILNNAKDYTHIILSADWHLFTHCSFKDNGGIWPTHCVQHTEGAAIFQPIMDAVDKTKADVHILTKGCFEDREEYSVLKNAESNKQLHALLDNTSINEADFCGIAGDYCVKDSVEDFHREFPNIKIKVLKPFVASIDGGKTLDDFLAKSDEIEGIDKV